MCNLPYESRTCDLSVSFLRVQECTFTHWCWYESKSVTQKHPRLWNVPSSISCVFFKTQTSWWFQPIWKILVNLDHFPKVGMKINHFWNHHLETDCTFNWKLFPSIHRSTSVQMVMAVPFCPILPVPGSRWRCADRLNVPTLNTRTWSCYPPKKMHENFIYIYTIGSDMDPNCGK